MIRRSRSQMRYSNPLCRARLYNFQTLCREVLTVEIFSAILRLRCTIVKRENFVPRLLVNVLKLRHQSLEVADAVLPSNAGRVDELCKQQQRIASVDLP